jgi:hypothetical protein
VFGLWFLSRDKGYRHGQEDRKETKESKSKAGSGE